MSRGIFLSILFHVSMLLFLLIGLPHMHRDLITDYAVVTEVVPVSELTNVRIKESNRKDEISQQTKKAPKSVEVAMDKEKPKPVEDKKLEVKEDAEKIPDKREKKPEVPEKPKEAEKKKEEKPKKKVDDAFGKNILKSLEEEAKKKNDKKIDKSFKDIADALKGETNKEYNQSLPMSMSEIDAIKSQISRNWNMSSFSGAVDAKTMQIILEIKLDIEGNILAVKPKLERNRSPYYRPFVESAIRAVKASSPLQNLSKDKFHSWKEIEFRFDASGTIY